MGSIPVRVTINTTLKWLCKAVWEFFLLYENHACSLFVLCFEIFAFGEPRLRNLRLFFVEIKCV